MSKHLNAVKRTAFYKATDMAGRDFFSGTVDYAGALASGEPTPALSGEGPFPGRGWYHLATVPTECIGMSWPCRLFEVEPVGDQTLDTEHPHKIGCSSVHVVREVDGHVALGPQGAEVAALIGGRTWALTGDEAERLCAAWGAAWGAARPPHPAERLGAAWYAAHPAHAAWYAARDAAGVATRGGARGAAWDASRDAWYAARVAAWGGGAAGDAAWGAAWYAARALVIRDLIGHHPGWDQAAYDLLTGPWRQAIGPVHPDDPTPP